MNTLHIKKNDIVVVLSGRDKGKKGKVISTDAQGGKVVVEGVNMATKHRKPRRQTDPGGIMHQETPIYACKVMPVCGKCSKPTRPMYVIPDGEGKVSSRKSRRCRHCKEAL
jgi:large subunit ribosomal protein L24